MSEIDKPAEGVHPDGVGLSGTANKGFPSTQALTGGNQPVEYSNVEGEGAGEVDPAHAPVVRDERRGIIRAPIHHGWLGARAMSWRACRAPGESGTGESGAGIAQNTAVQEYVSRARGARAGRIGRSLVMHPLPAVGGTDRRSQHMSE